MNESTCRSCGAKVLWVRMPSNALMPVDPDPHPKGNVLLPRYQDGTATGVAVVLNARLREQHPDQALHQSHFATCPFAARHRKTKE